MATSTAQAPKSALVYLDESGDLGWTFTAPYGAGGSSRFLTIAAVVTPSDKRHLPKRIVRRLYQTFGWPTNVEKKWSAMVNDERAEFVSLARAMCDAHPDIFLHVITVKKQNVQEHIRRDSNKLYNYMIRLSLLDRLAQYDTVVLIPDPRSIKVKSGNSLHDYLLTELWFTKQVKTQLATDPKDSSQCAGIQFCDMLAGLVQGRFELNHTANFRVLQPKIVMRCLFWGC